MIQERKTAGLLPKPVWLLVRTQSEDDEAQHALGPIYTLEKLKGVAEGVMWGVGPEMIEGWIYAVPEGCKEIAVNDWNFKELEELTFEQQLVEILWFDFDENCWDEEKEWNADRWQDVGMLLESFGIEFPGENAPKPASANGGEEGA